MTDPTEVTLTAGTIRGRQLGGGVVFRGIPYAAPPIGALRFRAPQSVNPWSGVRDATKWGSMAVQIPGPGMQSLGFGGDPSQDPTWGGAPGPNEDCLFINVTTPNRLSAGPEEQADRGAPVLVWIHGGGYVSGSGADVGDGLSFVRDHGIVFVSFNYRLGPLGFLHLAPLLEDPHQQQLYHQAGNFGLLDQIAALTWVQENIAAFGGDPDRVTIAGVSAGAKAVISLMAAPEAKGLFQQAISQSGGGDRALSVAAATSTAQQMLDLLKITSAIDLLTVDADQLAQAAALLSPGPGHDIWIWAPTIDGDILPDIPATELTRGSAAGVPLLIGSNARESATYLMFDPAAADPARANLHDSLGPQRAGSIIAAYERDQPELSPDQINAALMTDERYGVPTQRVADIQSATAPTYLYYFKAAVPGLPTQLTAAHGMDVPYVFGMIPPTGTAADDLTRVMGEYWATFISTGSPSAHRAPTWPRYTTTTRHTMVFDAVDQANVAEVVNDPHQARRQAWEGATWRTTRWFRSGHSGPQ